MVMGSQKHSVLTIVVAFCSCLVSSEGESGQTLTLEERVSGALWGLFVGDAFAMPVHWYYGGPEQIKTDFGSLLSGYEKSVHPYPDSIMQLSNTGGAGRGGDQGDVVGGVILHDKKEYWRRGGNFHYHHTLEAGENTLEASLARQLLLSVVAVARGGKVSIADDFRDRYVRFMTTPGTHNDTYASTCHRMFFQKWRAGVDAKDCPDNDGHNVDTMDGLTLPGVAALAGLAAGRTPAQAAKSAKEVLAVTRASTMLLDYVAVLTELLAKVLQGTPLHEAAQDVSMAAYGSDLGEAVRKRGSRDPVVACYIGGNFPALLHFAFKYARSSGSAADALLASANAGGENVHRNEVLGLLLGASQGVRGLKGFETGLKNHDELAEEIAAFTASVLQERVAAQSEL